MRAPKVSPSRRFVSVWLAVVGLLICSSVAARPVSARPCYRAISSWTPSPWDYVDCLMPWTGGGGGDSGPDQDSDGDGVPNSRDDCPFDTMKVSPGICGCGTSDEDLDFDGILDCEDPCAGGECRKLGGPCTPIEIIAGVCENGSP